ncbi:MAG: PIN domain-containing protein [bacterium]
MKSKTYLIDTNILVYDLLEHYIEPLHQNMQSKLKKYHQLKLEEIIIPTNIITEFENVYSRIILRKYHFTPEMLLEIQHEFTRQLDFLINSCINLPVTFADLEDAKNLYEQYKFQKISLTDCSLLAMTRNLKIQLLTADQDLLAAAVQENISTF